MLRALLCRLGLHDWRNTLYTIGRGWDARRCIACGVQQCRCADATIIGACAAGNIRYCYRCGRDWVGGNRPPWTIRP